MAQNSSSNPTQFWSFVSTQRKKNTIFSFWTASSTILSDHFDIADNVNSVFQSNFTVDTTDFNSTLCSHSPSEIRLCDITTSADEVKKLLKEINMYKSAGPDNVSPMLLNLASNSLAEPLSKVFNLALSSGTVSTEWKLANVVPLLKSSDPHDISNYRPISLCSTVGKILEKIVCRHIINHMYRGGIVSDVQRGFFIIGLKY